MQRQTETPQDLSGSFQNDTAPSRWGEITPDEYLRLAMDGWEGTKLPCDSCLQILELANDLQQ